MQTLDGAQKIQQVFFGAKNSCLFHGTLSNMFAPSEGTDFRRIGSSRDCEGQAWARQSSRDREGQACAL